MNKDVIYIDVDDDVTTIIGKVKKSKEKIVALVPPKRSGALQSAVNVRLLDRMARADKKQLVLITNNSALMALAANASIPVARNLQSKPEVGKVLEELDDDVEEIIDGAALPVGEHAETTKGGHDPIESRSDVIESLDIELDDEALEDHRNAKVAEAGTATAVAKNAAKPRTKIPNFDSFRKKLFLGIAGVIALAALLIWMFVFAPAATIVITARTSPAPVSATVKLGGTAATDYATGVVRSVSQQEKKDESVEFEATGQKDLGNKAKGVVRFSTVYISSLGTIPAGTKLTAAGKTYATDDAVTLTTDNASGVNISMTAVNAGTEYNGVTGTMSGAPSGVTATIVTSPSGGTSRVVKVVSADDIERAKGQLIGKSTDDAKKALIAMFKDGERVIDSSFTVERAEAVSTPAADQEVTEGTKPKLVIPTTYTIYAVPQADVESYLKSYLESQLGGNTAQQVFSTGADKAAFSNFNKDGETLTSVLTATGRIGPRIDEAAIKEQVKGKIYGEVQSTLQAISGIKAVDVKFSWFWVRTVPNDTNKIQIEFKVEDE